VFCVLRRGLTIHAQIDHGSQNQRGEGESGQNAKRKLVVTAKEHGHDEGTIGGDGCGKARDLTGLVAVLENMRNHAKGGAVDKTSGHEKDQEGPEEQGEVVLGEACEDQQCGGKHDDERDKGDARARADAVR